MAMDSTVCSYCKKTSNDLERMDNNDILLMMKEYNSSYTRTTKFCKLCKERAKKKYRVRRHNEKVMEKIASKSTDEQTRSYSNSSKASSNLSNEHSGSQSTSKRRREDDQPSRNVARRSVGPPKNRSLSEANHTTLQVEHQRIELNVFAGATDFEDTETDRSNQENSDQDTIRHSRRSAHVSFAPNVEYANDEDAPNINADSQDAPNISTRTGSNSQSSFLAAPMPRNPRPRERPPTSMPSPQQMRELSPQGRSLVLSEYNRGHGG